MKIKSISGRILIGSALALLLALAVVAEKVYFSDFEYKFRTRRFNRIIAEKEKITGYCLTSLKTLLDKGEEIADVSKGELFDVIESEGITILYYLDGMLGHWSDNSFSIPESYNDTLFNKPVVFIHNGWFLTQSISTGNEDIIALLRIKNDYGFENDLVKNGFVKSLRVPEGTGLSLGTDNSDFKVFNRDGKILFSLIYPEKREPTWFIIGPVLTWALFLLMLLYATFCLAASLAESGRRYLAVITGFIIPVSLYISTILFRFPAIFYETPLFSPYVFNSGSLIPSLGNLFLLSIFLPFAFYLFYRHFPLKTTDNKGFALQTGLYTLLILPATISIILIHSLFTTLVSGTNINFEPFRVLDLSFFSFIGFLSIILLLAIPVLYLMRIFRDSQRVRPAVIIISSFLSLIMFIPALVSGGSDLIVVMIFSFLLTVMIWIAATGIVGRFNMTVLLSLLAGLYSLYYILSLSEVKSVENKKILAVSYSTEHDPEAEHLLLNIWPEISSDTILKRMLSIEMSSQSDVDRIYFYLQEKYFNGYWGNFNLSVVTCRNDWTLWIASEETMVDNCFEFFRERVRKDGQKLTGTEFYFLDNQGGRPYYLGQLFYPLKDTFTNGLFIELYSDVDAVQAGYSELLLDKKYQGFVRLRDYSYAKYINGNLVIKNGEFPYDKTDDQYVDKQNDYRVFRREMFRHVLYKNGNITVIISEPRLKTVDGMISFAYLFAFILLVTHIIILLSTRPDLKYLFWLNFRQKLQVSFILVLLFSFISVGIIVATFSVRQYQARHLENIKEKINSIYIELENKLSVERDLTPDWRNESNASLNDLLIKLSNVFNTDINLYDKGGYLMATSRPEIFFRNLTSKRLNMDALINLETLTKSEYIQKEKVASLEYVSAYVPFYNEENQLLAYLNLPYFRMQSVLAREISTVVVAVSNFTLLLIVITMSIAVFISGRLTSPLRMLSEGLASVELGKRSEHLSYSGHDEISDMVRQYNHMVDELQQSAEKLANSERESAWREMAKQVAHEIKNPLTPMKLNVQQLLKSWKDGIPGFEKKLERFTKNQIEYIETLSSIASAFSSFAKMPSATPVEVNLLEQVKTTLELFKNTDKITFRVNWPHESQVMVYADKEHLNGIFSNLIKNAIQSVPQGREGVIRINTELKGHSVIVSVGDNGSGIPEELKKNLFTPNFTTKSSGMGLGLSIVKRYVETAGGRVWFESEIDKGSLFFVELPVAFTVERL